MKTDKNFYIYTRQNKFGNYSKLNAIGQYVISFLFYLQQNSNTYFHRIDSIRVTSQDRTADKTDSPHYKGKAIDIVVSPSCYMPYLFGLMSACLSFNFYLGTYTYSPDKKSLIKNNHIHIDNDYSKYQNFKAYENQDGLLDYITAENIESILSLYSFGWLESLQNFGMFKDDTLKYILTNYPNGSKLPFSEAVNLSVKEVLKEKAKAMNLNIWLYVVVGILGVITINKILPKEQKYIIVKNKE